MTDEASRSRAGKNPGRLIFLTADVAILVRPSPGGKIWYIEQGSYRPVSGCGGKPVDPQRHLCGQRHERGLYPFKRRAGNMCARAILDRIGIQDVVPVKEQRCRTEISTCPYPNLEIREVAEGA